MAARGAAAPPLVQKAAQEHRTVLVHIFIDELVSLGVADALEARTEAQADEVLEPYRHLAEERDHEPVSDHRARAGFAGPGVWLSKGWRPEGWLKRT